MSSFSLYKVDQYGTHFFSITWGEKVNIVFIEFVKTTAQVVLCAGVLLTFYLNTVNIYLKAKADQIENSYKIIEKWDMEPLLKARKVTREFRENNDSILPNDLNMIIQTGNTGGRSLILIRISKLQKNPANNKIR